MAKVKTRTSDSGSYSKSISVATDVPGQEFLRLSLTYRVVVAIVAKPLLGFRLNGIENEAISGRILLQRSDGEELEVSMDPVPFPIDIDVRTEPGNDPGDAGKPPGSGVWLVVTVPPQEEAIRHSGVLRLKTNHPDAERFEVPITVWVKPLIGVRPEEVRIDVHEDPSRSRTVRVRLSHGARTPFKVTAIEVSDPELFLVELDSERKQPYHELFFKLAEGVIPSSVPDRVNATVRVSLSEPTRPVVEIPVTLVPRKASDNPPKGVPRRTTESNQ